MSEADGYRRFESRAAAYAAARPGYPAALIDHLMDRLALRVGAQVADIGSGTGIFTRLLLDRGLGVATVEPGADMRGMAETLLGGCPGFSSVEGTARATGLATASLDAIFCAQAFHWFNEEATLLEWRRILRPGASAALIWNYHDEASRFVADYLEVVRAFGPEAQGTMAAAWRTHLDNVLFRGRTAETVAVPHEQWLDFDGLMQRAASTSYLPKPDAPQFPALAASLRAVFDRHQRGGAVALAYRTVAVFGPLG